jgi:hypothetical protein
MDATLTVENRFARTQVDGLPSADATEVTATFGRQIRSGIAIRTVSAPAVVQVPRIAARWQVRSVGDFTRFQFGRFRPEGSGQGQDQRTVQNPPVGHLTGIGPQDVAGIVEQCQSGCAAYRGCKWKNKNASAMSRIFQKLA